jgi:hypothetical protein
VLHILVNGRKASRIERVREILLDIVMSSQPLHRAELAPVLTWMCLADRLDAGLENCVDPLPTTACQRVSHRHGLRRIDWRSSMLEQQRQRGGARLLLDRVARRAVLGARSIAGRGRLRKWSRAEPMESR